MGELILRDATESDYPVFAALFPELGVPDPVPSRERFAETVVPGAIVLSEGGAPIGYAWGRPRGEWFHVVHVIVDPARRRAGAGRALMGALASRARAAGFERWMLNVKPENVAARALYVSCGMTVAHESVSMRVRWQDVARLPAAEGRVGPIAAEDDQRFEGILGLPLGEIASRRSLGRVVLGAERGGQPMGFLAFDRDLPGVSPICVRTSEYARPLLEALRPASAADADHLFVFVEGDPLLLSAFIAAGARPAMRVLRMHGEIPTAPPG